MALFLLQLFEVEWFKQKIVSKFDSFTRNDPYYDLEVRQPQPAGLLLEFHSVTCFVAAVIHELGAGGVEHTAFHDCSGKLIYV
jgi:hypothetical protein